MCQLWDRRGSWGPAAGFEVAERVCERCRDWKIVGWLEILLGTSTQRRGDAEFALGKRCSVLEEQAYQPDSSLATAGGWHDLKTGEPQCCLPIEIVRVRKHRTWICDEVWCVFDIDAEV